MNLKPALLAAILIFVPTMAKAETAIFAGGCFWCMESEFSDLKGVSDVVSGYAGGPKREIPPSYEEVSAGNSGFKEAVEITYDPAIVTYDHLLEIFWRNVDPFDEQGQFCDKGSQYVAAIFYNGDAERLLAEASLKKVEDKFSRSVATQVVPRTTFYAAEDYHQDYYKNNSVRYKLYRNGCGRDNTLEKLWGKSE